MSVVRSSILIIINRSISSKVLVSNMKQYLPSDGLF